MIPNLKKIVKTAIKASTEAGEILRKNFNKTIQVSEKKGAGLVTNVDLEAEEKAKRVLHKGFPDFGFLTEEGQPVESKSPGRWIIDPLDGTTNYVHGFPMFCTSIAAEWEDELVVGVIYHPILKDLYLAIKSQGASKNGKKIQVSETRTLKDSLLTTGFTYRKEKWLQEEMVAFEKLSGIARAIRRPGSAALDLAYTACGAFDGFWERRLSPWDVAAGALLVQEAGGKVTDFSGKPFRLSSRQLLASNSNLHPTLLQTLSESHLVK